MVTWQFDPENNCILLRLPCIIRRWHLQNCRSESRQLTSPDPRSSCYVRTTASSTNRLSLC